MLGVAADDVDLVREIEPALGLDHVLELRNDVAVLAVEGELQFAVVVFEDFVIHGESILESRPVARASQTPPQALPIGSCSCPAASEPGQGGVGRDDALMAAKDVLGRAGEDRAARYLE